jgi:hypothetical protein
MKLQASMTISSSPGRQLTGESRSKGWSNFLPVRISVISAPSWPVSGSPRLSACKEGRLDADQVQIGLEHTRRLAAVQAVIARCLEREDARRWRDPQLGLATWVQARRGKSTSGTTTTVPPLRAAPTARSGLGYVSGCRGEITDEVPADQIGPKGDVIWLVVHVQWLLLVGVRLRVSRWRLVGVAVPHGVLGRLVGGAQWAGNPAASSRAPRAKPLALLQLFELGLVVCAQFLAQVVRLQCISRDASTQSRISRAFWKYTRQSSRSR